jgi:basic amino acid/polyamine antiporter, APA family
MNDTAHLKRRIGPLLLTVYGIGIMIGAGIYVLIGVVAGQAGHYAPLSFVIAGIVALPSALAYAEFATRYPEAAGEVAFVEAGFASRRLALIVGTAVVLTGIVSAAAVLRGGAGYLTLLTGIEPHYAVLGLGVLLTVIAVVGVFESLAFAGLLTLAEVAALIAIVGVSFAAPPDPSWTEPVAPHWPGIIGAVALCFFAFIGFEDLENLSEEVRDPVVNVPRAIVAALAVTSVIYVLVSLAAVRAVPSAELAASDGPLALVWERASGRDAGLFSAIAVVAATNGVLAQIVMAARVLFGLGRRAQVFAPFHQSHVRFGTPSRATWLIGAAVVLVAWYLPVATLAEATSLILLSVFLLVNLALIFEKRRRAEAPLRVPAVVPWFGAGASAAALAATLWYTI